MADCLRCDAVLHRARSEPSRRSLALTLAGFAFYLLAVTAPFLEFRLGGQVRQTTLIGFPNAFAVQGFAELDLLVLTTTVLMPLAVLLLTIIVLVGIQGDNPPAWLPVLARWRMRLRPWAMTEVFLLGIFVAYTRLAALATVEIGVALYALGGLMLMSIAADALLDHATLWETIGQKCGIAPHPTRGRPVGCEACGMVTALTPGGDCPRCAAPLHVRKPNSVARTWAFLIGAALFYIPANVFPILNLVQFGRGRDSTILGGAAELLQAGMWPLALLVFTASIAVPSMKLIALSWMLIATHLGSNFHLRDRTKLYRMVDFIGRWSMIDVFMLAILVALVRMGFIASVEPRLGAACFAAVVILTMFAAASFDPRVMWDSAGEPTGADRVRLA